MMGNGRLHKIERFHTLGTPESKRLNVTALNLFYPTASPPFQKVGVFHITTQSLEGEGEGGGDGGAIEDRSSI
jgi:hypothetical protein